MTKRLTILVTGTSGTIGSALAPALAEAHDVVCMSRQETDAPGATVIQGDFTSPEDLARLDPYKIDALIHLAAVTSWGTEDEQLGTNVLGTRRMLRSLIDSGTKKFVLASSIAAPGVLCPEFKPLALPMPDEHPCLDNLGYGFSKYMMEELTRYMSRQNDALDFIVIRLAGVMPDGSARGFVKAGPPYTWGMSTLSPLYLSDVLRCFAMAAESPLKPGCRIMNAVGRQACVVDTVPEVMRARFGDELDLSHYARPGHERDPVFDIRRIRDELGFVPATDIEAAPPPEEA